MTTAQRIRMENATHPAVHHGSWPTLGSNYRWHVFNLKCRIEWMLEWDGGDDEQLPRLTKRITAMLNRYRYTTPPDHGEDISWAREPVEVLLSLSWSHDCDCGHCESPDYPAWNDQVWLEMDVRFVRAPGKDASSAVLNVLDELTTLVNEFYDEQPFTKDRP